jgi:hypothetical protein
MSERDGRTLPYYREARCASEHTPALASALSIDQRGLGARFLRVVRVADGLAQARL